MRILIAIVAALAAACGIPDTGCPSSQPANGAGCTSLQSCAFTNDASQVTCHCVIAAGSTDGTWQCAH